MENNCCIKTCSCTTAAVVISAILGVIAAFLNMSALIVLTPTVFWVLFGIAVGFLALSYFVSAVGLRSERNCVCNSFTPLLLGILLTILATGILLLFDLTATGIAASIIIGVLIFAFSLILTTTACLIRCLIRCD